MGHERGHVMEIFKNITNQHGRSWESAVKNNMHNAVGFIREEASKPKGPNDGGETCALLNSSAKMVGSSSVHHQFIISSSSVHQLFITIITIITTRS